jgi:hypothetical protein
VLAIGAAQLATISERRSDRLVNPALSDLPAFLTRNSGLESGYMIAQVTAAALVSEIKTLAHPASVDTIPTSANREDHVSMSMGAALKAERAVSLAARVRRGRDPLRVPGDRPAGAARDVAALQPVHAGVRAVVPTLAGDRPPAPDIEAVAGLILSGALDDACDARKSSKKFFRFDLTTPPYVSRLLPSARAPAPATTPMSTLSRHISAPAAPALTCKGWPQEAALRMLMNNLDPRGRRAPRRPHRVRRVRARGAQLGRLRRDRRDAAPARAATKRSLVQSGKPVGVFRTHPWAPRVIIANALLVPAWATWENFRDLEDRGLTMYGQMTAGSWIYIGTQGILQGTYETLAELARGTSAARCRAGWS